MCSRETLHAWWDKALILEASCLPEIVEWVNWRARVCGVPTITIHKFKHSKSWVLTYQQPTFPMDGYMLLSLEPDHKIMIHKHKKSVLDISESPSNITDNQMSLLERYILELYGSRASSLGAARLDRFNKSSDNDLRALPPSRDVLRQQSGYLWRQSVEEVVLPDPRIGGGI